MTAIPVWRLMALALVLALGEAALAERLEVLARCG